MTFKYFSIVSLSTFPIYPILALATVLTLISPAFAMETNKNSNEPITLIANDGKTRLALSLKSANASPTLRSLLNMSNANEAMSKSISCSLVNAQGLPYLKKILDAKAHATNEHAIIQELIAQESVETIYGVHQHMDCWQMPQENEPQEENELSDFEKQLNSFGHIEDLIISKNNIGYAVTLNGGFLKIDFNEKKVTLLYSEPATSHLKGLATNAQQDVIYFAGLAGVLHILNTKTNQIDHLPQKDRIRSIKNIYVSPDNSFILVAEEFYIAIYDHFLNKKEKQLNRESETPILITSDSKNIIFHGWDRRMNSYLRVADNKGNIIKEIIKENNIFSRYIHLAFANKSNSHIVENIGKNTTIYDLQLNKLTALASNNDNITSMSCNDNLIVLADESGSIHLWQFNPTNNTVTAVKSLKQHTDEIIKIVFSPNNKFIACAGRDQQTILIDRNGKLLNSWKIEGDRSKPTIAFSHDSEYIIMSHYKKTVIHSINRVTYLQEFKELPPFLQKKVLHEMKKINALSDKEDKFQHLKSLSDELENLGFETTEIKEYFKQVANYH